MHRKLPVEALLFDLGGVVIDIDVERMFAHWAPLSRLPPEELRARLVIDEAFEQHERGELSTDAYMDHLRHQLDLDGSIDQVVAGWNALLVDQIDTTLDLIDNLRPEVPCYAFSNTSAVHRAVWETRFPRVMSAFERLFLSFEMGMRKPDPEAYRAVADEIVTRPGAILFFDDTLSNVTGASAAGLQAVQVLRPDDVTAALRDVGLL